MKLPSVNEKLLIQEGMDTWNQTQRLSQVTKEKLNFINGVLSTGVRLSLNGTEYVRVSTVMYTACNRRIKWCGTHVCILNYHVALRQAKVKDIGAFLCVTIFLVTTILVSLVYRDRSQKIGNMYPLSRKIQNVRQLRFYG